MAALVVGAGLLAGCGGNRDGGRHIDPVAWWHNLEGGPIAAQRPPPPGADEPYPNLATVPPKPKPIDPALRASVSATLASDRADATYEAAQAPLVATPAKAANGLFAGAKPLPAADPDAAGAALDAATPAPGAASPPVKAKVAPVQAQAAAVPQGDVLDDKPIPDAAVVNSPMPEIPDAPPAQPHLPGVVIPVTVPHLPPKAPPAPRPKWVALQEAEMAPVGIGFPDGSAILPTSERGAIAELAGRRHWHDIAIVGFGETDATDPQSQLDGVRLGLARARAVAVAFENAGVPMAALHMAGNAPGRGAAVRLIQ